MTVPGAARDLSPITYAWIEEGQWPYEVPHEPPLVSRLVSWAKGTFGMESVCLQALEAAVHISTLGTQEAQEWPEFWGVNPVRKEGQESVLAVQTGQ